MISNPEKINKKPFDLDLDIAKDVGVDEAIMFCNISFWCKKNAERKSRHHFHEGCYWMFNSVSSFKEQFNFWTESQIKRILKNLIKAGCIKKRKFNKKSYDRTSWYTTLVKKEEGLVETIQPLDKND